MHKNIHTEWTEHREKGCHTHIHHTPTQSFRVWNKPVEWQLAPILQPWQPAPWQEIAQPSGSETVSVITLYGSPSTKYITCVRSCICYMCAWQHCLVWICRWAFPVIPARLLTAHSSNDENRKKKSCDPLSKLRNSAIATRNSTFFLSAIRREVVQRLRWSWKQLWGTINFLWSGTFLVGQKTTLFCSECSKKCHCCSYGGVRRHYQPFIPSIMEIWQHSPAPL